MKRDGNNILSFDQGAGFYLRTGRRQAEAGNLVRALSHLRTAHEKDPDNAEITIGSNYMPWEGAQKCADILKLAGYNYGEKCYER